MFLLLTPVKESLTITFRIQVNKRISRYHLAWDFNVLQNLRGLLKRGVQEDLDWDEKVEGTDNVLLEAVIGYARSVGIVLWYEIEEDCSKVHCHLGRSSFSLGARVPGFQWEHAEYIAGIETICPAFAQQEHPVHIWNVIWVCAPNVPISNISFTAGMRPCHVSKMYPPRTFQMLSTHVHKMFPAYAQLVHCGYTNSF
jgi:hypothetical protein